MRWGYLPAGIILIVMELMILTGGCGQREHTYYKSGEKLQTTVSTTEIRSQLGEFDGLFTSRIKTAAFQIDQTVKDPKVQKMTLLWRTRATAAIHNILEQSEPMASLIDSWCLCVRLRQYFEDGLGNSAFGAAQPVAVDTSIELENHIENIAQSVLSESVFQETRKNVHSFALANPLQMGFGKALMYATETRTDKPNPFVSALNIPLSPFKALQGVDETPAAIYDFSSATRQLTNVVEELPESARWQLLMLLYEMEETNVSQSLISSLEKISQSSSQLSEVLKNLPQLVEEVDQNQDHIQKTLQQTQQTITELRGFLADSKQTAAAFSSTANDVTQTAQAWGEAAKATEATIKLFKPEQIETNGSSMDLKETVEAITRVANQIEQLNRELPSRMEQATLQIQTVSNMLTIRIAFLVLLIFALLLTYRLFQYRLAKNKKVQVK